ncbi:MAG TPA: EamA family transporter [Candidatus Acidoferrales bacterium]|nr:EamA family transporter [Candidatus Acidoferrales bacterium]
MSRHPLFKPYLALVAVCFFWGTTYLGIRMSLETFPPMILVCVRYIISGSIMLIFSWTRDLYLPKGRELMWACFSGLLTLGVGNGCLVLSETMIPSGIAGLIVTISPFWMVGVEALLPGGERLHAPTIAGMAVGMAGAALLFTPDPGTHGISSGLIGGFLLLQFGMAGWSFGSIMQRRNAGKAHPVIAGGVQQLAAGLAMIPWALFYPHGPIQWSTRGVSAILYLITFGSLVGYSAFVYCMDRLPVAIVSIYPYVNAVVAVSLGWLFYREPFGLRETGAMIIIFAGVAAVKRYSHKPAEQAAPAARR